MLRIGLFFAAFLFSACKGSSAPIAVAVSIPPLYDLSRRIVGEDGRVVLLASEPDADHTFSIMSSRTAELASSKLCVIVGLGLDESIGQLAKKNELRTLRVGDRVPTLPMGDRVNPYVWLDPSRAQLIVKALAEELAKVDPSHAAKFRKRGQELEQSLAKIDEQLEAKEYVRAIEWIDPQLLYFVDRYRITWKGTTALGSRNVDPFGKEGESYEALVQRTAEAFAQKGP